MFYERPDSHASARVARTRKVDTSESSRSSYGRHCRTLVFYFTSDWGLIAAGRDPQALVGIIDEAQDVFPFLDSEGAAGLIMFAAAQVPNPNIFLSKLHTAAASEGYDLFDSFYRPSSFTRNTYPVPSLSKWLWSLGGEITTSIKLSVNAGSKIAGRRRSSPSWRKKANRLRSACASTLPNVDGEHMELYRSATAPYSTTTRIIGNPNVGSLSG
ncbi:hypothetical protein FRC11_010855 [Ceratobasidium sp. 423]|nr:hypothetical protein FRC11_010855 [Ceratobasidium sp. 423]